MVSITAWLYRGVLDCATVPEPCVLFITFMSAHPQVTRIFAEDFCELWRADLGLILIPQLLNAAVDLKPGVPL